MGFDHFIGIRIAAPRLGAGLSSHDIWPRARRPEDRVSILIVGLEAPPFHAALAIHRRCEEFGVGLDGGRASGERARAAPVEYVGLTA